MDVKELTTVIDRLGGRKMVATFLALLAGGITVAFRGDVPANYLALLRTALGAFVGGNIAEHWSKNIKATRPESAPASTAKLDALAAQTKTNTELLMAVGQAVHTVNEILVDAKARAPKG